MNGRLRTGSRVRILLLCRYTGIRGFFSFGNLVASMPKKPNNFDEYISSGCGRCRLGGTEQCRVVPYRDVLHCLREMLLESGLAEQIKWSVPCYTDAERNIVTLAALKRGAILSFFRGNELNDTAGVLQRPGENSRTSRYFLFQDLDSVVQHRDLLLRYVAEAIEIERCGRSVKKPSTKELSYPIELTEAWVDDAAYASAFEALTPGRRRGYLLYFSNPKQSKTIVSRIEKCRSKIMAGKGLNEH